MKRAIALPKEHMQDGIYKRRCYWKYTPYIRLELPRCTIGAMDCRLSLNLLPRTQNPRTGPALYARPASSSHSIGPRMGSTGSTFFPSESFLTRIDVEKSAYHYLSQNATGTGAGVPESLFICHARINIARFAMCWKLSIRSRNQRIG